MAILLPTETRSFKGRLIHAGIIALLLLGGVTMVYPFLVMLSGSVRSAIDEAELDLIPDYLMDDAALYRKFLEFKYNGDINALNRAHRYPYFTFAQVPVPERDGSIRNSVDLLHRYYERQWILGGTQANRAVPANLRRVRETLIERYDGDLMAYVEDGGDPAASWLQVVLPPPRWFDRRYDFPDGPMFEVYQQVMRGRPFGERMPVSLSGHFLETMIWPTLGRDDEALAEFAEMVGSAMGAWQEFQLAGRLPRAERPRYAELWDRYVRTELHPGFIRVVVSGSDDPAGRWIEFLLDSYGSLEALNESWGKAFTSWDQVQLPHERNSAEEAFGSHDLDAGGIWKPYAGMMVRLRGGMRLDYERFLDQQASASLELAITPDTDFGGGVDIDELEWGYVKSNAGELRRQFAFRNYINVWDELAGEGRALWNTVIYCTLSIVLALLVNPLAAYGLSRFRLRGGYKALLVLMATMAFPPMVTLIPQFIVLRNLGLMNTFVALLLPLIANGYLIFLLKGFFDSLPRELYEAGTIDGASELRMFFQIAMALSKPILAVVALQTFTAAYTMFLYALLVAPDRDMWLISVWLFQYQERASSSGVFASVVIASVPTLVLFLLVQRTIMRGIVVPTEK